MDDSMTSRIYFWIASLFLVPTFSCCMLGGSEMATKSMAYELEDEDIAFADAGGESSGERDASPDDSGLDGSWDDDGPQDGAVVLPRPTLGGHPLYAQATDDDDDSEDDVTMQKVVKDLAHAKDAGDRVDIQKMVIEENLDDADDLNDELAKILEELRREKGLEEAAPYVSPVQEAVDPILEEEGVDLEVDPESVAQQIEEALEESLEFEESLFDEEIEDYPFEEELVTQDQEQEQADR